MNEKIIFVFLFLLLLVCEGNSQIKSLTEIQNIPASVSQINSIAFINDSVSLLGTDAGVVKLIRENGFQFSAQQFFADWKINIIKIENSKSYWVGTYFNSIVNITDNNEYKEFSFNTILNGEVHLVTSIFVTPIEIWIGTSGGKVLNFNRMSKKFVSFDSPGKYVISSIISDETGLKWIATPTGLYYSSNCTGWRKVNDFSLTYDLMSGTNQLVAIGRDPELKAMLMEYSIIERQWKRILLPVLEDPYAKLKQLSISPDPIHYITMDYGIIEFNPETSAMKVYNTKEQLHDVVISKIASKGNGKVLISSAGRKMWYLVLD
jgi:hypothetical protein